MKEQKESLRTFEKLLLHINKMNCKKKILHSQSIFQNLTNKSQKRGKIGTPNKHTHDHSLF